VRRTLKVVAVLALAGSVTAACNRGGHAATPPTTRPTTTSTSSTTSTTVPPTTTTAAGTCAVPPRAVPDPQRPRYVIHIDVRPAERRVVGDLTVRFTPDLATDKLVFRLWPNGPRLANAGAKLTVGQVQLGAHNGSTTQPDPTTLVVALGAPLAAGQTIEATVPWELTLPGPNNDRIAQIGDSIRLGSFFPILAWEPGVGWAMEPPTTGFAEASLAPAADFDMAITVPAGLNVLATGIPDEGRTRWHAEGARDAGVSVGRFHVAEANAGGVHITVGVADGLSDNPATYAGKLAARMATLATLFGPYPWPAYTVALTPNLSGGIEYPMHVMQGPNTGGGTTTHELSHQWFFGLVGNNQGRDPWLDEGLATYAESRADGSLTARRATVIPRDAVGHLTSPMTYWQAHQSSYFRGVYVQGTQAMASLGDVNRVDCALRIYVARNAYRIARPADLLGAVAMVFGDTSKLASYGVTSHP
jgi:hypothetical protein